MRMKVVKTMPGTSTGVRMMLRFQDSPDQVLYMRADTYPPMKPRSVYRMTMTVPRLPRFEGERKPRSAKKIVKPVMTKSCAPEPRKIERSMGLPGGRNTSPWMSFHPESSCTSSSVRSSWLYRAMSLRSARSRIMPTEPVRNMTMMVELIRKYQWMWVLRTCRYLSQRVAQGVDEARQCTE